mmetsp:Transcript_151417/g.282289  ORF Transcript_151417/g.282289 Transcript_151417/m.282289 type:complete len:257 (-) Transcript_151417:160-930(-)
MFLATRERMSWQSSGSEARSARISAKPVFVPVAPSIKYVPNVNGKPTKPRTVAPDSPTLSRSSPKTEPTKGTSRSGLKAPPSVIRLNASRVRIGSIAIPPASEMLKSTPIAGSGVRMSEKRITPSVPYASHGCSDTSLETSGISERSRNVGYFSVSARYAAMCRPACRIIQTGVRSTVSPRAARTSSGSLLALMETAAGAALLFDARTRPGSATPSDPAAILNARRILDNASNVLALPMVPACLLDRKRWCCLSGK